MSKDNLILFPKKSRPIICMTRNEAKWMLSGSLLIVLTLAVGVNRALFSQGPDLLSPQAAQHFQERSIASINPIFRVSWEKKAFEVLKDTKTRDLASIGRQASSFENLAFGFFEGQYQVREANGKISEIRFSNADSLKPKLFLDRKSFFAQNLSLFSKEASEAIQVQSVDNNDLLLEKYRILDKKGQDLSTVLVLMDKDQNLLSMTVQ